MKHGELGVMIRREKDKNGRFLHDLDTDIQKGCEIFKNKYGYLPLNCDYRVDEGPANVEVVNCIANERNILKGHFLLYPVVEYRTPVVQVTRKPV